MNLKTLFGGLLLIGTRAPTEELFKRATGAQQDRETIRAKVAQRSTRVEAASPATLDGSISGVDACRAPQGFSH